MVLTRCAPTICALILLVVCSLHGIGFASFEASEEAKKVRITCNNLLSVYKEVVSVISYQSTLPWLLLGVSQ
jgi:hypothetical protein